ncbi:IS200/IS605 family transposase [Gemella sanguinis]|nr:IS200/IS605 family transposase [Gemella sanguinis]NKZ26515.1 IS200/IS605 family transposase [Gemella sanguinis]
MANKQNSLSHTKWLCKYHIVFTPKYRRKIEFNQYKRDIVNIIQRLCKYKGVLCKYKGVEIIEGHIMPDHIHLLLSIPPKYSVSSIMGYLKGKSSLMIFDMHSNMKYKYGNRKFWAEGYYVSTVGLNESAIREYTKKTRIV